jgi:hypothetical protein
MKFDLKHILKKYLKYYKIRRRFKPENRLDQKSKVEHYKNALTTGDLPNFQDTGFRLFSQFEEDGLLLYVFTLIGMTNKLFIEFGSDDGINSNSANLYYNHDFTGLFLDGNENALKRGRHFFKNHPNPKVKQAIFKNALITAENINDLIKDAGFEDEIALLSIDIDGNDYWVWKAIHVVSPQVVIIETHNEFGMNDIIVPYDPEYFYPGKHPTYHGASPIAMTKLANKKGYRLIGANQLGFNFIYIRNDLLQEILPEVSVASLLQHPSNKDAQKRFEEIKDWDYVSE